MHPVRWLRRAPYLAVLAAACAASFGLAWAWAAVMPMAYLDPEYPVWRAKLALLQRCDLGEVLIVGDSRAAVDVVPAMLPMPVTNLAVGGGMPVEAYLAVARALSCPAPPRRVVISLDAAHFMLPDLFWERSVKYGFVTPADLALLDQIAAQTGDASLAQAKRPDGLPAGLRGWLYARHFPPLYAASLLKGVLLSRLWQNRATFAATLASHGQYFFGRDAGSSTVAAEGHLAGFLPLPVLDRYFDRLLALLASRGIPAWFIAMPLNQTTVRAVRPEVRAAFAAYLQNYAARYANFQVVGPVMPAWPDRYFGDEFSHLNPPGAALLSRRFGACLQALLSQGPAAACVPAQAPPPADLHPASAVLQ